MVRRVSSYGEPQRHLAKPMPFWLLCVRYLTPAEARKHGKHAAVIVTRKPKKQ